MDDFKPQQPQQPQQSTDDKPDDFQATYENKPETYVTPSGEPTTLSAAPQPSLEIPKKKKSGAKKWLLAGLVLVLLAGLGAFAYWQWSEADTSKKELSSTQSQLQEAQANLAKANATADESADEPVTEPAKTDAVLVTEEATRFVTARGGVIGKATDRVITTTKLQAPFASVSITAKSAAGGFDVLLKKESGEWVVIWDGNGQPTDAEKTQYGVPSGFYTQAQ